MPKPNAGADNDADRALAIGVTGDADEPLLQLLADVTDADATALQLKFDVEAWDARRLQDNPGEAAFDVAVEIGRGDGFVQLLDFGVTTGASLSPPTGDFLDGNADANRVTFDSGMKTVSVSAGSQLRIRWSVPSEAAATGWVYGLDNVELSLFGNVLPGDFNGDGMLNLTDLNQLAQAIATETHDPGLDLTGDNVVNQVDLTTWVTEIKNTWFGDANLDGEFNSADLIAIFTAGEYEDGILENSSWSTGDWNGDREFDASDLIAAFTDGGYDAGPRTAVSAVPEPSCVILLGLGIVGLGRFLPRQ